MKTAKLKTFYQNPDNPQKYGDDEIAALVESIRKEPRTLGAANAPRPGGEGSERLEGRGKRDAQNSRYF